MSGNWEEMRAEEEEVMRSLREQDVGVTGEGLHDEPPDEWPEGDQAGPVEHDSDQALPLAPRLDRDRPLEATEGAPDDHSELDTPPGAKRGPAPITTRAEVEATRAQLEKDGFPSGERSIAKALGVGRDAVRYALGKDR